MTTFLTFSHLRISLHLQLSWFALSMVMIAQLSQGAGSDRAALHSFSFVWNSMAAALSPDSGSSEVSLGF